MGSIVFYRSADANLTDDERRTGMVETGTALQTNLTNLPFVQAMKKTLDDKISDNTNYRVRYEFKDQGGNDRSFEIGAPNGWVYPLDTSAFGFGAALVPQITRDEVRQVKASNPRFFVAEMSVVAPRRSGEATAFDYLNALLSDLNAIRDAETGFSGGTGDQEAAALEQQKKYMTAALCFQRCK